jgi:hypothetical protein
MIILIAVFRAEKTLSTAFLNFSVDEKSVKKFLNSQRRNFAPQN